MKKNKILLITFTFVLILLAVFAGCQSTTNEKPENTDLKEFIGQRIEGYTKEYFRFTEDVKVDAEAGNTSVAVTFVPEVGSIVIKEDLYENIAAHAYQITKFFPEVTYFDYTVLWDENLKRESLYLTIYNEKVENLEENYINQIINRNGGLESHFEKIFSEIIETAESKTWRDRVDPNSDLP